MHAGGLRRIDARQSVTGNGRCNTPKGESGVGAGEAAAVGTARGLRVVGLEGFMQAQQGHPDENREQVMARMFSSYRFHDVLRGWVTSACDRGAKPCHGKILQPIRPVSTAGLTEMPERHGIRAVHRRTASQ